MSPVVCLARATTHHTLSISQDDLAVAHVEVEIEVSQVHVKVRQAAVTRPWVGGEVQVGHVLSRVEPIIWQRADLRRKRRK